MGLDLTPEEERRKAVFYAANVFALACRTFEEHTPAASPKSLVQHMNDLMTELWGNGFSQDEIREAFEDALGDMSRYAVEARNGTGIRGTSL
jgi:hypothetical protein